MDNSVLTASVVVAPRKTFETMAESLIREGNNSYNKKYEELRERWTLKTDTNGVVEIPVTECSPLLLRALTCLGANACMDSAEDICDGEFGVFLDGHVFVSRPATHVAVTLGANWGHFTSKRFVEGGSFFPLKATKEEEFFQNPNLPAGVWALVIEGLYIDKKAVIGNTNLLRELLERGNSLRVGFLVTTHQKGGKQWLKVAAMVPLSMQNLEAVKDIAADLLETFPWLRLDASINVSVRRADKNGCVQKDHTGGQQAVAHLEGGSKFADKFLDPKTQKAGSWRFPVDSLPIAPIRLEKEAREEFEAAIAAKNSSEEEEEVVEATSAPVEDQESSINSQSEWRMRSWADDDDDDDLDESISHVMPAISSRQAKVTPIKEESLEQPEPVTETSDMLIAPKKKNRRGTRGKGRAC